MYRRPWFELMLRTAVTVSRGEGGQQKQLLVLDDRFRQVDAVQLDIGPRHFASDAPAVAGGVPPSLPVDLRRGDRCCCLPVERKPRFVGGPAI